MDILLRNHTTAIRDEIKKEHNTKFKWLLTKWKPAKVDIPNVTRDVVNGDSEITPEFSSDVRIYGGVHLDDDGKAALALSPKFELNRKLNPQVEMQAVVMQVYR